MKMNQKSKKQYKEISLETVMQAKKGNQAAMLEIVKQLTPLICRMTKHWDYSLKEDAIQSGALAITAALMKYSPMKHCHLPFNAFVIPYLKNELSAEFCRIKGMPQRPMKEFQKALYQDPKPKTLKNGMKIDNIEAFINMGSYEGAVVDGEEITYLAS